MDYTIKETDRTLNRKYSVSIRSLTANPNEECIRPHWHEKFEFIAIDKGSLFFTIDKKKISANANSIVAISPNLLHSASSGNEGCSYRTITFDHKTLVDDSLYEQLLKNNIANSIISVNTVIEDDLALQHFNNLAESVNKNKLSQPIIEKGYCCLFFSYLIENFSVTQERHHTGNTKFDVILDYISQNFTRQITTKSIAERFSYNKSYFCRKFYEITNLTPTEYILRLRLEYAQNLITTSLIPLSDISQQSGFSSYPYFSTKFKNQFGMSPGEWRDKFIANNTIQQ